MRITVNLWGQLKQNVGAGEVELALQDDAATAAGALRELARSYEEALGKLLLTPQGDVRKSTLLFRGDEQIVSLDTALRDGEVVTVMSPISGG